MGVTIYPSLRAQWLRRIGQLRRDSGLMAHTALLMTEHRTAACQAMVSRRGKRELYRVGAPIVGPVSVIVTQHLDSQFSTCRLYQITIVQRRCCPAAP